MYIRIVFMALVISLFLRVIKIKNLFGLLKYRCKKVEYEDIIAKKVISAVLRVSSWRFFVIRNNCLRKSLLLYYFLIRSGLTGLGINIGVTREQEKLIGHSWLVLCGKPYLEEERFVEKYKVILQLL